MSRSYISITEFPRIIFDKAQVLRLYDLLFHYSDTFLVKDIVFIRSNTEPNAYEIRGKSRFVNRLFLERFSVKEDTWIPTEIVIPLSFLKKELNKTIQKVIRSCASDFEIWLELKERPHITSVLYYDDARTHLNKISTVI